MDNQLPSIFTTDASSPIIHYEEPVTPSSSSSTTSDGGGGLGMLLDPLKAGGGGGGVGRINLGIPIIKMPNMASTSPTPKGGGGGGEREKTPTPSPFPHLHISVQPAGPSPPKTEQKAKRTGGSHSSSIIRNISPGVGVQVVQVQQQPGPGAVQNQQDPLGAVSPSSSTTSSSSSSSVPLATRLLDIKGRDPPVNVNPPKSSNSPQQLGTYMPTTKTMLRPRNQLGPAGNRPSLSPRVGPTTTTTPTSMRAPRTVRPLTSPNTPSTSTSLRKTTPVMGHQGQGQQGPHQKQQKYHQPMVSSQSQSSSNSSGKIFVIPQVTQQQQQQGDVKPSQPLKRKFPHPPLSQPDSPDDIVILSETKRRTKPVVVQQPRPSPTTTTSSSSRTLTAKVHVPLGPYSRPRPTPHSRIRVTDITNDDIGSLLMPSEDWSVNIYPTVNSKMGKSIYVVSETLLNSNLVEIVRKSISILPDWRMKFSVMSVDVPNFNLGVNANTIGDIQVALMEFDSLPVCEGIRSASGVRLTSMLRDSSTLFPDKKYRSRRCPLLIVNSNKRTCFYCTDLQILA